MMMELRERLRALQTATTPRPAKQHPPAPLPYLLPLETEFGLTYFNERICIEHHGQLDLKNLPEPRAETLQLLSLDPSVHDFQLKDALFLDIETTGTAGGTGTYAFLVGLGFAEKGYFQVRQYFLHDLAQERAFLHAVGEFSRRFGYLVTYNGKCFDTQILRNRYLMHRRSDPFADKHHIDALFIARRLWKRRFGECDLGSLEKNVLEFYRADDIPGYLIPAAYTDYLRYANSSLIQQVLHHNVWDILSLAVLTVRACMKIDEFAGLAPEEHHSVSLLHERRKDYARAVQHQLEALKLSADNRSALMLALAKNLRRIKDTEQMSWLLGEVAEETLDIDCCRQICILCEHDLKQPATALTLVDAQIKKLEKFRGLSRRTSVELQEWLHRKSRLERKIQQSPVSGSVAQASLPASMLPGR